METVQHVFSRQALSMLWDFAEAAPLSGSTGSYMHALELVSQATDTSVQLVQPAADCQLADAREQSLPEAAGAVWFTDPPYYDSVPYADLSDFFFVWLRRALPANAFLRDPFDAGNPLTPKDREIVQDVTKRVDGSPKDRVFFERAMARAFSVGRATLNEDGIGSVVFAHKTTEGWEALLSGMTRAGWVITGSWPITSERPGRLRAQNSAALATSVHLICRPRTDDRIGDWEDVVRELPRRVGDWMERLQSEGVRGADLVFACIGPALEIYSRYGRVETAEGREVPLAEYLPKVWEVVGRAALEQVLGTAEALARNGAARVLEEDARLTALFLWTVQATDAPANGATSQRGTPKPVEEDDPVEDDEEAGPRPRRSGPTLIFDVVRRFAQALGIHLDEWEGRVVETEKGVVRLLPVRERAVQLFGKEGARAAAERIEATPSLSPQLPLFTELVEQRAPSIRGRIRRDDGTIPTGTSGPSRVPPRACCSRPAARRTHCEPCSARSRSGDPS